MKLIIGNLKMNLLTPAERDRYLESFQKELANKNLENLEIVLCPPVLHLDVFAEKIAGKNVAVGAQNIFWDDRGSYTGEISPLMVKNFGGQYAIVGHSERRKYFGETDEMFNVKIKAALKNDLAVVFCVGETAEEKKMHQTSEVITQQLEKGLNELPLMKINKLVVAYEPVWAVGSDEVPAQDEIMLVRILIRKILIAKLGEEYANKIKILYGGSVNARTAEDVCLKPGMDGVLVGRESLIPVEFLRIAEIINKA